MHGSDGIWHPGGHVHPRVYGSAGRWLGPYVRDRKLFSLEEAVHKLTGKSAARFGLDDRGVVRHLWPKRMGRAAVKRARYSLRVQRAVELMHADNIYVGEMPFTLLRPRSPVRSGHRL